MPKNLISQAYQSAVHQYTAYQHKKAAQRHLHALKTLAAEQHDKMALDILLRQYQHMGWDVSVMYVKPCASGKLIVSPKPPRSGKKDAADRYRQLRESMGIKPANSTSHSDPSLIEAREPQAPLPSQPPEQTLDARPEAEPPQDDRSEEPDPAPALTKVADEVQPKDPHIAEAIAIARAPEEHFNPQASPAPLTFAYALSLALPVPPGAGPRMTIAAKLEYYLSDPKLSAQLTPDERQQVIAFFKSQRADEATG